MARAAQDGPLRLDGRIAGDPLAAKASFTLTLAGARVDVAGELENPLLDPSYELELNARHDDFTHLVATFADSGTTRDLGPLAVSATATGSVAEDTTEPHAVHFEATLGPTTLRGDVTVEVIDGRPNFNAAVAAEDIVLDPYLAAADADGGQDRAVSGAASAPPDRGKVVPGTVGPNRLAGNRRKLHLPCQLGQP